MLINPSGHGDDVTCHRLAEPDESSKPTIGEASAFSFTSRGWQVGFNARGLADLVELAKIPVAAVVIAYFDPRCGAFVLCCNAALQYFCSQRN